MLIRVVRGGNDDACVRVQIDCQICDGRRWNNAEQNRVAAAGRQTRDERALQHIRGNARVLADDDGRLRAGIVAQRDRRRLSHAVGKLRVQRFIGNAPDAVSSK